MRPAPLIKPWHEEYALSDTSPSGVLLNVGDSFSIPAGVTREITWPDTSMRQQCICPGSFTERVIVGWEFREAASGIGGTWSPVIEEVLIGVVREILIEHAERERQIHLLEQHLEELEAA